MRNVLFEHSLPAGAVIRVVQGDLTLEEVDAIVNAANEHLAHGGGVAGAIVRRGGYVIQEESDAWVAAHGLVRTGAAAITSAGALPARFVIHAVGPVWGSGDEDAKLAGAVRSALALAEARGLRSIALPGISSGIFGFPKERCAEIIIRVAREFLAARPAGALREINLCNLDAHTARIFQTEAERQFRQTG